MDSDQCRSSWILIAFLTTRVFASCQDVHTIDLVVQIASVLALGLPVEESNMTVIVYYDLIPKAIIENT